jgi:ectoine hydroxylase-related dioxygenase (phytanoyl-CoA dioxygenase family)
MGRGTPNLYTSWTPFSDVPYAMGGLMLMEKSHEHEELVQGYGQTDVDLYCKNEGEAEAIVAAAQAVGRELTGEERQQIHWNSTGSYSDDAITTREKWGGRWLVSEYEMGDVLVFCMHIMHASSDNQSACIRLSSDSRYQLASEKVDERWIGDDPPAHGIRAKRGMVC